MSLEELDKLIEKLESVTYHEMEFHHIQGMIDVLKELRKNLNTAKTMNISYLKIFTITLSRKILRKDTKKTRKRISN